MTIAKRLLVTLVVASLSLLFVGGYALWQLHRAGARFDAVASQTLPAVEALGRVRGDIDSLRRFNYRYIVVEDGDRAAVQDDMHKTDARLEDELRAFQNTVPDNADEHALFDADRVAIAGFRQARAGFMMTARGGDIPGARAILLNGGAVDVASGKVMAAVAAHADYEERRAREQRETNDAAVASTTWMLAAALIAGLLIALALGAQVYAIVTGALNAMRDAFQHVGNTLDLSTSLAVRRNDEAGAAVRAFNLLLERVSHTIRDVRRGAESVNLGSREIAAGNTDLSARTEEQAAALEETAASMEELTATVRQNVESARTASTLSGRAADLSEQGNQAVADMVGTMGEITTASAKIAEIT